MSIAYEGGIRPNRIEFVREADEGVTPDNPEFLLYSDNVRTLDPTINPQTEAQRGLGSPDPIDFRNAVEAHELTLAYDLQQWVLDSNGNPQDAMYDAVIRDANNAIPNSHTVVRRMEQFGIEPSSSVEGEGGTAKDTRQYYVGRGGKCNATITGDPSNPQPDLIELSYQFEKSRLFQIDQPENEPLTVYNESDEEITIYLENEGSTKFEQLTVAAGANTDTADADWDGLDAVQLESDTSGNVRVENSDGENLAVLYGADEYDHNEGDIGVPVIGDGAHADPIGEGYAVFHSDEVRRPDGTPLAQNVVSTEGMVENSYGTPERSEGARRTIVAEDRVSTVEVTVFGETEHYQNTNQLLRGTEADLVWLYRDTDGRELGTLQWDDTQLTEAGASEETSEGFKEVDLVIEGQGVTIDPV